MSLLDRAWNWRTRLRAFDKGDALRVFHGPGEGDGRGDGRGEGKGEGSGEGDLRDFAIDRFGDHYWVTEWSSASSLKSSKVAPPQSRKSREKIVEFLKSKSARSIVGLSRPEQSVAPEVVTWFGNPVPDRVEVTECGAQYWIHLQKTRHPGLFLDHAPLRAWLKDNSAGLRVLNTFAYTGSLSIAAALGGAQNVTTLDLGKPVIQWAKENWELNRLSTSSGRFIAGDVFEWLPRFKRQKEVFDCVILDPPSFSHGKAGKFSTARDLEKLHALAMDVLSPEGILVTSINSANITWKKYEADVAAAAKAKKMDFAVVKQVDLPETFPTLLGNDLERYLKGWILKAGSSRN